MGIRGESLPSFCNGLGSIYIWRPLEKGPFDPTTKDMGLKFKYALEKVLGTQDRPTLRLAFHHCVCWEI